MSIAPGCHAGPGSAQAPGLTGAWRDAAMKMARGGHSTCGHPSRLQSSIPIKETAMSDTYVLVHGAWHTGDEMEATAACLREAGHTVHCPTLAGNRPEDDRATSDLTAAIESLVGFLEERELRDVRLVGHS